MKIFTVIFVFFLLLLAPALLSLGIREIPLKSQGALVNRHKIYGDIVARQEFISQKNGLSAIAVTIRNFNLVNKKDITLTLVSEDKVVREAKLNGANIPDGAFVKFKFDSIPDSFGKRYLLYISSPNSTSAEAFEIYFGEDNKTVAFSDYYKISSKAALIRDIYKSFALKMFADRIFAVFYLALTVGSAFYLGRKRLT